MRLNVILRYVGLVVVIIAAFMLLSAAVAWGDSSFNALLLSSVLTLALGAFPLIFVERATQLTSKEGYLIVILAWMAACIVGAFPFMLWRGEFDIADAWFESVSGFTTTGATAVHRVELLPRGLLFWRSCTHWLGGVGVVMFALVILPSMGRTKSALSSAELSSLAKENYRYRSHRVAQIVLMLYFGLTAAAAVSLRVAGMGWFDAINHAASTIATGGFSTHTESIGYWDNGAIEAVVAVFVLLSGVHYGLLFGTLMGRHNNIFRSEVSRFYFIAFFAVGALVSLSIWHAGCYATLGASARHGFFQAASAITSAGFSTTDTTLWTPLSTVLLFFLMIVCGCAGSTSGGVKVDRIWLSIKAFRVQLVKVQHPNAVVRIKLGGIIQEGQVVDFAIFFIVLYLLAIFIGTAVCAAAGLDLMTSFSMITACMGNGGIGFGTVGSAADYAHIAAPLKVFCTIFMLLGRLEIFGLLQLFAIKWR